MEPIHDEPATTRRRFITHAAGAAAGAILLPSFVAACGSSGTSSGKPGSTGGERLRARIMDVPAGSSGAPIKPVIVKQGYLDGSDLDVSWVGTSPGETQTKLISNAIDIGSFGSISAIKANEQGNDIRLIAPGLNCHANWIVKDNSGYKSLRDLRGKRIATLSETTSVYQCTMLTATLDGFDFKKDFQVSTGAPPAIVALFKRGDVDAIVTTEPTSTILVSEGATQLASVNEMWKKYNNTDADLPLAIIAAHKKWLDASEERYRQLFKVFEKFNKYMTNPDHIKALAEILGVPKGNQAAIDLLPKRMGYIWSTAWDTSVFDQIRKLNSLAVEADLLKSVPKAPVYLPAPK